MHLGARPGTRPRLALHPLPEAMASRLVRRCRSVVGSGKPIAKSGIAGWGRPGLEYRNPGPGAPLPCSSGDADKKAPRNHGALEIGVLLKPANLTPFGRDSHEGPAGTDRCALFPLPAYAVLRPA